MDLSSLIIYISNAYPSFIKLLDEKLKDEIGNDFNYQGQDFTLQYLNGINSEEAINKVLKVYYNIIEDIKLAVTNGTISTVFNGAFANLTEDEIKNMYADLNEIFDLYKKTDAFSSEFMKKFIISINNIQIPNGFISVKNGRSQVNAMFQVGEDITEITSEQWETLILEHRIKKIINFIGKDKISKIRVYKNPYYEDIEKCYSLLWNQDYGMFIITKKGAFIRALHTVLGSSPSLAKKIEELVKTQIEESKEINDDEKKFMNELINEIPCEYPFCVTLLYDILGEGSPAKSKLNSAFNFNLNFSIEELFDKVYKIILSCFRKNYTKYISSDNYREKIAAFFRLYDNTYVFDNDINIQEFIIDSGNDKEIEKVKNASLDKNNTKFECISLGNIDDIKLNNINAYQWKKLLFDNDLLYDSFKNLQNGGFNIFKLISKNIVLAQIVENIAEDFDTFCIVPLKDKSADELLCDSTLSDCTIGTLHVVGGQYLALVGWMKDNNSDYYVPKTVLFDVKTSGELGYCDLSKLSYSLTISYGNNPDFEELCFTRNYQKIAMAIRGKNIKLPSAGVKVIRGA